MVLIYMGDKTMTKQACDVGSHGGRFWVALECSRLRWNVSGCAGMFQVALECFRLHWNVPGCAGVMENNANP